MQQHVLDAIKLMETIRAKHEMDMSDYAYYKLTNAIYWLWHPVKKGESCSA